MQRGESGEEHEGRQQASEREIERLRGVGGSIACEVSVKSRRQFHRSVF